MINLQAEITRDDSRLLVIANRRATLTASLNALRDHGAGAPLPRFTLAEGAPEPPAGSLEELLAAASDRRPEVARARVVADAAEIGVRLAEKASQAVMQ